MHYLTYVAKEIDKTHPNLGNLAAMAMLTIKAKKCLLVVSPRGCGKSRVTSFVGCSYPDYILQDRISIASLGIMQEDLNGYTGVVVVDDIAKSQTPYARITTITTLAELIYSHYCRSAMVGSVYNIQDFYGCAMLNIQPVLLARVVESDEWEASIQDKTIRYYHLYRPKNPNPTAPQLKLEWGIRQDAVNDFTPHGKVYNDLKEIAMVQWTLGRIREHLLDLLKSCAALDGRNKVTSADYLVLRRILQPLLLERLVINKKSLETDRSFANDFLAILTEFVSYGNFTLTQLAEDYKISASQAYKIMSQYSTLWVEATKSPTSYAPSRDLTIDLAKVGLI